MSIHQALLQLSPVETRLLVLFWHLAERWGRVTPDGISVRLRDVARAARPARRLPARVGDHRAAAHRRERPGRRASRTAPGCCTGSPPDELAEIHWAAAHGRRRRRRVPSTGCPSPSSSGARSAAARPGPRRRSASSASCSTCATASTSTPSPSAGSSGTGAGSTAPRATPAASHRGELKAMPPRAVRHARLAPLGDGPPPVAGQARHRPRAPAPARGPQQPGSLTPRRCARPRSSRTARRSAP